MTVPLAVKDPRLALALAAAVPMAAASVVHGCLVTMMGRDWSDLDWSGLGPLAAVDAGLPVRTVTWSALPGAPASLNPLLGRYESARL